MKKLFLIISFMLFFLASNSWAETWWIEQNNCSWSNTNAWATLLVPSGGASVPGPSDDVRIGEVDQNSSFGVCLDTNYPAVIKNLKTYGDVNLWIQTGYQPCLTMGDFDNYGDFNISSWKEQDIDMNSLTNHSGAELSINHNIRFRGLPLILNEGEFEVGSTWRLDSGESHLDNQGSVQLHTSSEFEINSLMNTGTLNCYGGALSVESTVTNSGIIQGWGFLSNEGSTDFQNLSGGSITAFFGTMQIVASTFINEGVITSSPNSDIQIAMISGQSFINKNSMTLNAGGGVAILFGDFTNATGTGTSVIEMKGGHLSAPNILQESEARLKGFGTLTGNIEMAENAQINLSGPTNIFGDVTVGTNATLEIKDGQTLITGHTNNNGTIYIKGGTVVFQGGLTDNGIIIYESSNSINAADFNHSGSVDGQDLAIFAQEMGWTN